MKLPRAVETVTAGQRLIALRYLAEYQTWDLARQNEALIHGVSRSDSMYYNKLQQVIHNLSVNADLRARPGLALLDDEEMSKGTVIEDIARERRDQMQQFQNILQEKYNLASRSNTKTTMRCRRCGGTDIHAEQKQTRGADEAMTVFCTCARCTLRWTMR